MPLIPVNVFSDNAIPVGSSVMTSSGNLKNCKSVIHTVGPDYGTAGGLRQHNADLVKAYMSIFQMCDQETISSVAIPFISSGKGIYLLSVLNLGCIFHKAMVSFGMPCAFHFHASITCAFHFHNLRCDSYICNDHSRATLKNVIMHWHICLQNLS